MMRTDVDARQRAIQYLSADELLHIGMLEPIRRSTATLLAVEPEGVLLHETRSGAYMLSARSPAATERLLALPPEGGVQLMALHQPWGVEEAQRRFELPSRMICHQTMWPAKEPPAVPPSPLACRTLAAADAEAVQAMYEHAVGLAYIRARIDEGEMLGAFDGAQLTGFIGLHAEGAMGMLHVDPAWRGQGIATILTAMMITRLLKAGRVPFAQFVKGNEASRRLNEKMGFAITPRADITWLER